MMHRLAFEDRFANGDEEPLVSEDCESSPLALPLEEVTEVVARFTGEQFTKWLTCFQLGAELLYVGETNQLLYDFLRMVDCPVDICERVAQCLTENNEELINALADAITNNPTLQLAVAQAAASQGAASPGTELPQSEKERDSLPENVKDEMGDCDLNALWGALLGLVQYGNRAISDFFEILEAASNGIERGAIASGAIPAAGNYVSAAIEFADQVQEEIAENYAAAYTETFEQQLACALFCIARDNCELSIDDAIQVIVGRLGETDFGDFLEVMNYCITGTFVGDEVADVAFLLFFTAIKFGTEFAGTIAVRALTVQMGLGADFLASDNWEALCDCPETCLEPEFRVVNPVGFAGGSVTVTDNLDGTWTAVMVAAFDTNAYRLGIVEVNPSCCWNTLAVDYTASPENLLAQYNCGANPTDEDYDGGIGTGPLTVGLCAAGMIASDVDTPFTVTWTFEACP